VTGHEVCGAVASDQDLYSSAAGVHVPPTGVFERGVRIYALEYDQPEHRRHRQLLREAVGDRPIRVPEQLIRSHAGRLIAQLDWTGTEPVELVNGFTNPLPLDVIFDLMGADPEFKPEMKALVDALLFRRGPAPGTSDPAGRVIEIAGLMAERRRQQPAGDWLSHLVGGEESRGPLSPDEATSAIVALITGGHHSTSRALASLIARVLTVPGLQQRLREDPSLIPAAIDETLRLHTPLPSFSRRATGRGELAGGITVEAGEDVLLVYAAANRDPAVFDRPDEFDLGRDRRSSMAFGYGPHRCVGIHLATAELRVALEELLAVAGWLELAYPVRWAGPAEPEMLLVRASVRGSRRDRGLPHQPGESTARTSRAAGPGTCR
jgi:cytochrome P450